MKRVTYLKIVGLGWCIPQLVVMAPFAFVTIAFDKLAHFFSWASGQGNELCWWLSKKLFPPTWWPSHRYLQELEEIRAAERTETVDRLHGRVSRKDTPA